MFTARIVTVTYTSTLLSLQHLDALHRRVLLFRAIVNDVI